MKKSFQGKFSKMHECGGVGINLRTDKLCYIPRPPVSIYRNGYHGEAAGRSEVRKGSSEGERKGGSLVREGVV